MDVKNTKEVLSLMVSIGNAVGKSLADGKIGPEDLGHLLEPISKVGPALGDIGQVVAEIKDMSPEERDQLLADMKAELVLPQQKVEMAVEAGLDILSAVHKIGLALKPEEPAPAPAAA